MAFKIECKPEWGAKVSNSVGSGGIAIYNCPFKRDYANEYQITGDWSQWQAIKHISYGGVNKVTCPVPVLWQLNNKGYRSYLDGAANIPALAADPQNLADNFSSDDRVPAYPCIIVHSDFAQDYNSSGYMSKFLSDNGFVSQMMAGYRIAVIRNRDAVKEEILNSGLATLKAYFAPGFIYDTPYHNNMFYIQPYNTNGAACQTTRKSAGSEIAAQGFDLSIPQNSNGRINMLNGFGYSVDDVIESRQSIYYPSHNSTAGRVEWSKVPNGEDYEIATSLTDAEMEELIDYAISPSGVEPSGISTVRDRAVYQLTKKDLLADSSTRMDTLTNRTAGPSESEFKYFFQASGSVNIPNGTISYADAVDTRTSLNVVPDIIIENDSQEILPDPFTFTGYVLQDNINDQFDPNDSTTYIGVPGALFFYRKNEDPQTIGVFNKYNLPTVEDLTLGSQETGSLFVDITDPTQVNLLQSRLKDLKDTKDSSGINFDDQVTVTDTEELEDDVFDLRALSNRFDDSNNILFGQDKIQEATGKRYNTVDEFKEDWALLNGTTDSNGFFKFDNLPNQLVPSGRTKKDAQGNTVPIYVPNNKILIMASGYEGRVFDQSYDDGRTQDIEQRGLQELLYPLKTFDVVVFDDIQESEMDSADITNSFKVGGCVYDEVTRLPIVGAEVTFGRFRGVAEKLKLKKRPYQRLNAPVDGDTFDQTQEGEVITELEYQVLLQKYEQLPDTDKPNNNPRENYKQLSLKEAKNQDLYPVKTGENGCFEIEIFNPLDIMIAKGTPIIDKDGQTYNLFEPQSLQDLKDIRRTNKALDLLYEQDSENSIRLQDEVDLKRSLTELEKGIYVDTQNPGVEISKEAYDGFVKSFDANQTAILEKDREITRLTEIIERPVDQGNAAGLQAQRDAVNQRDNTIKSRDIIAGTQLPNPRIQYRPLSENEKQERIGQIQDDFVQLYQNFDASTFLDNAFNVGNTTVNQRRQLAVNNIDSILQGNPLFSATITGSAGNLIDINTPNTLGAGFNARFGGIAPVTTDSYLSVSLTDVTGRLGDKLREKNAKLDEILREPLLRAGEYYGVAKDLVTKGLGASSVLNSVGGKLGNKISSIQNGIGKLGNTKIIIRSKKLQTRVSGSADDIQQAQEIYDSKNRYITKRIDPFTADGSINQNLGDIFMRPRYLAFKINYRQLQYPELFPQLGVAKAKLLNAGLKLQAISGGLANFRDLEKSKRRELIKQKIKRDILPSLIESVLIPLGVVGIDTLLTDPLNNLEKRVADRREARSEACPKEKVLQDVIRLNNGLKKTVNGLQKAINTANALVLSGQTLITVTQAAIEIGLFVPYIIAPFSPDTPTKVTGDKVEDFRKKLAKGQLITTELLGWLIQIGAYLNVFVRLTQLADQLIARCMEEAQAESPENIPLDPDLIALNEIIDNNIAAFEQPTDYGSDFIFEIQTDSTSFSIPRKRAIAKNQQGVILLTGEYSFTSTSDILIDELKYYIKINNLKAE